MRTLWGRPVSRRKLVAASILSVILFSPLASLLTFAQPGHAPDEELIQVLNQLSSLHGEFSQLQYDTDNVLLGQSSGTFSMLRPGYFSWRIESPDSQLIIATPEFIWHHDIDLETVTRRPIAKSGALSPLQILGGNKDLLRSQFVISKNTAGDFILTPDSEAGDGNPGFSSLTLKLENSDLTGMEIIDALNQRVVISFENVDKSQELSPEDFSFTPPEGVDLFYYDE